MQENRLSEQKINEFKESLNITNVDERIFLADKVILFDVEWTDDKGNKQVNKGYRVKWNNANGPYKGGLRFHPSVNLDLFKSLAFEQTFKNVLTTLPMGGAKGGSDFDPHNKSDNEIKTFCYAFMEKLYPYIGVDEDIPAGDIGVGAKEIRYLYEAYKLYSKKSDCSLTGKPLDLGGSLCRKEATGYGLCYITNKMLNVCLNESFKGKSVVISGSGNVAIYAAEKAIQLGAKVIAMSDSSNAIYDHNGVDLKLIKEIKEVKKDRIKTYLTVHQDAKLLGSKDIWTIKADIYLPCATQNEIDIVDAKNIIRNGAIAVCEGSNMSCTNDAVTYLQINGCLYLPGKASNAGGVSVSGLEIMQNKLNEQWPFEKVDIELKEIMENIFTNIYETCEKHNKHNNYLFGANYYAYNKLLELMK